MEAILQSSLGQTILEPGVVTIGSTPDSRIVVHDARVSPHHAILRPTEQGYTITDWGSTEGTFVNEQRLEPLAPRLLAAGDRIRLGETVYTYEVHEGTALVPTQVSRPENEPAVPVFPSEPTVYASDAQAISAPFAQTVYGSVPQQGYAPAFQQPGVPPDVPGAVTAANVAPPPPLPYTLPPIQNKPPTKGGLRNMPRRWKLIALIALIVLLVGGSAPFLYSWLSTILPAASASVTMTPASQRLTKSYTISAVTTTPSAANHQVQARFLSFTTKTQSKTVKATGQGGHDATAASGTLIFTNASENASIGNVNITSSSRVVITNDAGFDLTIGGTTSVAAHAVNSGSSGNIPAYDINGTYAITVNNVQNGTVYIQNTSAFTGGQDSSHYTFVQQSDIDGAATPLVDQLTSDAQTAIQQQIKSNEQFVGSPACTPNTKANHKANDKASDVTVTVTVTCKGEAYDAQAATLMAVNLLNSDAASQLGAHYALVGNIGVVAPQVVTTDAQGTVTLNSSADGMWVYQFSDAQKHAIAQLISGKSLADAQTLLLQQEGVKKVSISTAGGWGHALPTSVNDIKFTIVAGQGLQATPGTTPGTTPTATSSGHTIGEAVQVGNMWVVTVNSVKTSPGSDVTKPKSGNIFIVVDVSVKNTSSTNQDVSSIVMFNLQDATGQAYTEVFTEFTNPPDATVSPNSVLQGQLVYEVPSKDHAFTFSFQSDSTGSDLTTWNVSV